MIQGFRAIRLGQCEADRAAGQTPTHGVVPDCRLGPRGSQGASSPLTEGVGHGHTPVQGTAGLPVDLLPAFPPLADREVGLSEAG